MSAAFEPREDLAQIIACHTQIGDDCGVEPCTMVFALLDGVTQAGKGKAIPARS